CPAAQPDLSGNGPGPYPLGQSRKGQGIYEQNKRWKLMEHLGRPLAKMALLLIFTLLVGACKGTKSLGGGEVDPGLSARQLIGNPYDNQSDFTTLSGRIKIEYSNGEDSQGFTVSLRLEKDKVIWISGPMGMIKAMISPD